MKVVIVGGVAGGATTAARLRRLDETAEILLIERGEHISFANCGLPYYVGNVIKEEKELLLQTPRSFYERFHIEVRIKQEVIKINRKEKTVEIKNLETGEVYQENYDKLVLSPGAEPIHPFQEQKTEKIKTLRNVKDATLIKEFIEKQKPKSVAIIGGGYIGVEMAENLSAYPEMKIHIIEKSSHLIAPLDEDMANLVHRTLEKRKIDVVLENGVLGVTKKEEKLQITLEKGTLEVDFIILCIGVRPESKLAKECGIETNEKGSILVNEFLQTNDQDIYALGDAIQVKNFVTKKAAYIPLAGPANKQARVVANHICKKKGSYEGTVGSSILKIFDYSLGMTGINESTAIAQKMDYKVIVLSPYSHATYYPKATQMTIKAIYEPKTGKILGAQVWGKEGVDKITDILATAIRMNMTAYDLEELELCYAPPFSSAKSPVNLLGNAIENDLQGLVDTVTWKEAEKLLEEEGISILDVRTKEEYDHAHYEGSIHIPLDSLRERLEELDKNKTFLVYCRTGLRSYIACRILTQNGFTVKNITGGFYYYQIIK